MSPTLFRFFAKFRDISLPFKPFQGPIISNLYLDKIDKIMQECWLEFCHRVGQIWVET